LEALPDQAEADEYLWVAQSAFEQKGLDLAEKA
jgi:hypothetical protein